MIYVLRWDGWYKRVTGARKRELADARSWIEGGDTAGISYHYGIMNAERRTRL